MSAADGLLGLRFLVGRWRGEGTWRGAAVVTRSRAEPFGGEMIRIDVETFDGAVAGGRAIHRERIVFKAEPDGRVTAATSPWRGGAQTWTVEERSPGVWTLTHPALVWTIRRTDLGYEETFGKLTPSGAATPDVVLRHRRDEDATP